MPTIPVTARFDSAVVKAVDLAVAAGIVPNRTALVVQAVEEWLARHSEEAILESYRRRYADGPPISDDAMARIAAWSVAACLADEH